MMSATVCHCICAFCEPWVGSYNIDLALAIDFQISPCPTLMTLALSNSHNKRITGLIVLLACWASGNAQGQDPGIDFFESKVRPLLIDHCYECHSTESGEAGGDLVLDSAPAILRGGTMGPALVPKQPDKSLIIKAVGYGDKQLQMPPSKKLDEQAIQVLRRWIKIGAPDPRQKETAPTEVMADPMKRDPKTHWAFVPPKQAVAHSSPPPDARDLIDAFAASAAASANLPSSKPATGEQLIRRLYFDLTGLPPSVQQIQTFVSNSHPAAYRRTVDRLLASPEFGERFGRHWLDVARYADTVGYALAGKERDIKGSHRYRDWVIGAFAGDMPYDQMIRHQLVADRTDPKNEAGNLDAMGFLTVGRKFLSSHDTLDDQIDVVSRGLLGMTVSCARCHDHKFDPIPTKDYYSLYGIMQSNDRPKDGPSPLMLVDKKKPRDTHVFIRGQAGNRGEIAPRSFLTALRRQNEGRFNDGSGRKELADRIVDPTNPLTARVMVNRVWATLIGKPLVGSPSDFGFRTQPPAVPEILDDLAADFARHWSVKKLVRRIVLSQIYRQSSFVSGEVIDTDPEYKLLARANRKRRDFESLRDSILHVADSLDRTMGGPSVELTLASPARRRTIYGKVDRQNLPAVFRTFDFASPDTHSPKRYFTTVPQQALYLLNNGQMHFLATRAGSTAAQKNKDPSQIAVNLFRQILSRNPTADELQSATKFLSTPPLVSLDQKLATKSPWSYGTSKTDKEYRPIGFEPFPKFVKSNWQIGAKVPVDGDKGYAHLGVEAGHTPRGELHAVVRRWTAVADGTVRIIGQMGHRSQQGDGVQASIFVGGKRIFTETQKSNNRPFGPLLAKIKKGQNVDMVMTPGKSDSFDTFYCKLKIKLNTTDGQVIDSDSVSDFGGPNQKTHLRLDRAGQLAQVLMLCNEFIFID